MIAVCLMLLVGLATLAVLQGFTNGLLVRSTSQSGSLALDAELDRMRDDAASAYAVFVPDRDVFGNANAVTPGAPAHEIDFYTRTDSGVEAYWAYDYDAKSATLRRYDYDTIGHVGATDRMTGAIDAAARYPVIGDVRAFDVKTFEADQLTSPSNPYAPAIAEIIGASIPSPEPVGFLPVDGGARDDLYGGNTTIVIHVRSDHGSRLLHLATAVMPSGFTIHERPTIRGVIYRLDQVHRSFGGVVQITHAGIYEQLLYSYDTGPQKRWQVWCDFQVYGAGGSGLRLNDPNTVYRPNHWLESMEGLFVNVENGAYADLNPSPSCSRKVPLPPPSASPAPGPGP